MGESWYRQEYCCSFEALEGLVYVDFARCVVDELPENLRTDRREGEGRRFGGIDFGLRNPFAAIWGTLDRDGILWLTGEHYSRNQALSYHVKHLPRDVTWYGDPSGAREIKELICAGITVRRGDNDVRPGIQAVRARLENGTLRVLKGVCPNLLAEAGLYRYNPESPDSEEPLGEYDHAMDALRYLVSKLDAGKMARFKKGGPAPKEMGDNPAPEVTEPPKKRWLSVWNEELWTPLG
ncbi:MAG TPA: hypothetical protein VGX70_15560 [Gemmataceae bacterium]|nr:hypothetical protein [Gemmataceae bacterium]